MTDRSRVRGRKIAGTVAGLFRAGGEGFETTAVGELDIGFEGIPGDVHAGLTRRTTGREPWYRRGTVIRNDRQLSLVSPAELAAIAGALGVPEVRPEWIGANMTVEGIADLTWLPPRTLLFFPGGLTLKIDGDNHPCRATGRSIARHFPGRGDIEPGFARAARHRRGLVAWVEKPGHVATGDAIEARLPEQWIYG